MAGTAKMRRRPSREKCKASREYEEKQEYSVVCYEQPQTAGELESLYVVYRVRHQVADLSSREETEIKLLEVIEEVVSERILYFPRPSHYEIPPAEAEKRHEQPETEYVEGVSGYEGKICALQGELIYYPLYYYGNRQLGHIDQRKRDDTG